MTQTDTEKGLEKMILQIMSEQKPETMSELIDLVSRQLPSVSMKEITQRVNELQNSGRLRLTLPQPSSNTQSAHIKSGSALWYWLTIATTLLAMVSLFTITESAYSLAIVRYIFAAIFIFWLPGYAFVKALFPVELPVKTRDENMDIIERAVLSSGMSLVLVTLVGLVLNYTPWGISLTPIVLSLTALTLIFATAGLIRENQARKTRSI